MLARNTPFASGHYHLSPAEADALENIGLSSGVACGRCARPLRGPLRHGVRDCRSAVAPVASWPALYVAWFLIASPFLFWSEGAIERAPRLVELGGNVVTAVGFLSVFALLLVFPGDRFAPWVLATAAAVLASLAYLHLANIEVDWIWSAGVVLALGTLLAGLILQIVTAIRTDRDHWLRLALTAGGIMLFVLLVFSSDALSGISQPGTGLGSLARRLAVETTVMVLPMLFGVGVVYLVMRRGLWDLDLSLNRAFVYSALTALLVAVYFLVVVLVQAMVNDVAGIERSTLAVVISTGLIAVLALPAREWVQRFIDRVFFRRRYDLERTVESFEARLQDRDRLELVGSDLLDAASDAFEPEHASLWVPEVRR